MSVRLAQCSVGLAVVDGFRSYEALYTISGAQYVMLQALLVGPALLPMLRARPLGLRLRVPLPTLLFVTWWVLSYWWSSSPWAVPSASYRDLTTLSLVLLFAQLLAPREFFRTIILGGYVAIALVGYAVLTQPGLAYPRGGSVPGLVGGFIHKNFLAPAVIVTCAAVLSFEVRPIVRRSVVTLVAVLVVLAETSTGLFAFVAVLVASWALSNWHRMSQAMGRARGFLGMFIAVGAIALGRRLSGLAAEVVGKDATFSSRTEIWDRVSRLVERRPWTGYGYSAFYNAFVEPARSVNTKLGFFVTSAHNGALELLFRLGVVGLVLWCCQFAYTFWRGAVLWQTGDPRGRFTLLFCTVVLAFGFSESHLVLGFYFALLSVLSLPVTTGSAGDLTDLGWSQIDSRSVSDDEGARGGRLRSAPARFPRGRVTTAPGAPRIAPPERTVGRRR